LRGLRQSSAEISRAFHDVLQVQPEVRIDQMVFFGQVSPIAELAVVTRDQQVDYTFTHNLTWAGKDLPFTEKKVQLKSVYRAKAGFNLKEPFRLQVNSQTGEISADLPPARILSLERVGDLTYRDDDTWLNRLTPEERTTLLNQVDAYARQQAEQSGLGAEAEAQVQQRLQELLEKNGRKVEFRWSRPNSALPNPK
jgi:hypothetical protein